MREKRKQFMVSIDTQAFKMKPTSKETGVITNRIIKQSKQISLKELAKEIKAGKTYLLCRLKRGKSRRSDNWEAQNLFVLDIDEGITIEEALEHDFIRSNASFLHTTFSHTDEKNKFRIIFALSRIVSDEREYDAIINYLFENIPQADKACRDKARLFYGGKEVYWIDEKNRLNVDEIVGESLKGDKKRNLDISPQSLSPKYQNKIARTWNHNEYISAIKENNVGALQVYLGIDKEVKLDSKEILDYIKTQPLDEYLGVNKKKSFLDIFHEEEKPSASIFISNNGNGHWLYKCFSDSAPFVGSIVEVTQKIQNSNKYDAVKFLKAVFKINPNEEKNREQFLQLFDYSLRYIADNYLKEHYPDLYKVLIKTNSYSVLIKLLAFVRNYVNESGTRIECYHAMSTIANEIDCSKTTLGKKINLFAFLGLCEFLKNIKRNILSL